MKNQTSPTPPRLSRRRTAPRRGVFIKTLATIVPVFAFTTLAHATLLLSESFDSLTAGSLNGQDNWTANTGVNVITGGLSYTAGSLSITGGTQSVQSAAMSAPLASNTFTSQSGDVWMSFTLVVNSSINADRYWFSLGSSTNISSGFNGTVGNSSTGNKNLAAEARTNTSAVTGTANAFSDGQTVFIVARVYADGTASTPAAYNHVDLWIDPTSTTLGTASSSGVQPTSAVTSINSFALTAITSSGAGPSLQWDNLLVGTSQADVLDVYAIPEPSTYAALGGLAALGLAALRRRRA